jgi:hypothetical protein
MDKHHRIDRRSEHYFQPFKGSSPQWVADKYPSAGLQTVNTQTFKDVFLHPRATQQWGFKSSYLDLMTDILEQRNLAARIPADALSIWLFKDEDVGDQPGYEDLVQRFFREYNINSVEQERIFSRRAMDDLLPAEAAFAPEPLEMTAVTRELPPPPDADEEGGRTIRSLRLSNAGPAREMQLEFGQRLTIVTGDNGLGKSFLLDFAWWAATGVWADKEALPSDGVARGIPQVEYTLSGASGRLSTVNASFDSKLGEWIRPGPAMAVDALAVFSRANGSFAVADPLRGRFSRRSPINGSLTTFEVWHGRPGFIEGLIRDWVRWQRAEERKTFDQFKSVLKRLSPEDLGTLRPGEPILMPDDDREIPTIRHNYGTVPVTHASSGVQRVLLLAYLIIWSWQKHEAAAARLDRPPIRRMLVIVDELEAHLHPKWQRIVLPALMGVGDLLSSELAVQAIAATHSPMILASMEATFDASTDLLYHLYGAGTDVKLEQTNFVKYGDVSGWLTSPLFGLRHARSREAERAIEAAKRLQLAPEASAEEVAQISATLSLHLADDDKFWPRWLYFAEQHGVVL